MNILVNLINYYISNSLKMKITAEKYNDPQFLEFLFKGLF